MNETVKIKWSLSIGLIGGREDEYDTGMTREEWDGLADEEREQLVREIVFEYIEWSYEVAEPQS